MSALYIQAIRFPVKLSITRQFSLHTKRLALQTRRTLKQHQYGKYAKYEKPPNVRLQFNKHFFGWKKWVVIAYNIGLFKLVKYGIIGYVTYRYWNYIWPVIKYGATISAFIFIALYWLRYWGYRALGPARYEELPIKIFKSRFENIFKEYSQLTPMQISYLTHKTWIKCVILRNHRKWLKSIQRFLTEYKPIKYYLGEGYSDGIAFQPLLIEYEGYFKGNFTWFVDRKESWNQSYGWIEMKIHGNLSSRVVNVEHLRLHVHPKEGGEVLKFKPFRLTIDDNWDAQLLDEEYNEYKFTDDDDDTNKTKKPKLKLRSKKKPTKIVDADYTMKKSK